MARRKAEAVTETAEKTEHTFTKALLAGSKRFSARRDLLNAILKNDRQYTISEVEELVEEFMKGKVSE
ncbi:MAG: hypothetical protein LUE87_02515 [Lachnospiraceae bacterium]|nr:hypothetical protein [Lachnospiraceae bacterium]